MNDLYDTLVHFFSQYNFDKLSQEFVNDYRAEFDTLDNAEKRGYAIRQDQELLQSLVDGLGYAGLDVYAIESSEVIKLRKEIALLEKCQVYYSMTSTYVDNDLGGNLYNLSLVNKDDIESFGGTMDASPEVKIAGKFAREIGRKLKELRK